jgi:hypothetical protein
LTQLLGLAWLETHKRHKFVVSWSFAGVQLSKYRTNLKLIKMSRCLQKQIHPDFNDTEDLINQSNKREMDACEIANFLASELFMHQVKAIFLA